MTKKKDADADLIPAPVEETRQDAPEGAPGQSDVDPDEQGGDHHS